MPFLSIVIPAHNEEQRLPPTLEKIQAFRDAQDFETELLIVENGSTDGTLRAAREYAAGRDWVRVVELKGRGKGLAVREGMLEARGEYRFICDADLSMPIELVLRFLPPAVENGQVVIATREGPGARRFNEPNYRHLIGRVFNLFVRALALPGLNDSQCGFKLFSAEAAQRIFPLQTMLGWSFDVEVLFIARRMGYQIHEVPIDWYYEAGSRVRLVRDSLRMFADLLTIRMNDRKGVYGLPAAPRR